MFSAQASHSVLVTRLRKQIGGAFSQVLSLKNPLKRTALICYFAPCRPAGQGRSAGGVGGLSLSGFQDVGLTYPREKSFSGRC